jgi:hypothetical protein
MDEVGFPILFDLLAGMLEGHQDCKAIPRLEECCCCCYFQLGFLGLYSDRNTLALTKQKQCHDMHISAR